MKVSRHCELDVGQICWIVDSISFGMVRGGLIEPPEFGKCEEVLKALFGFPSSLDC